MQNPRHIVIVGGGIIGCTTAFYLTQHPSYSSSGIQITILEASTIAGGASGKAGGLVAKWAYPRELVDVTFTEHERLAKEHNGAERWGWRYTNCGQWEGRGEDVGQAQPMAAQTSLEKKGSLVHHSNHLPKDPGLPEDLDWIKDGLTSAYEPMAAERETAQVHPYLFTTSMLELAQEAGAEFIKGKVTSIEFTEGTPNTDGKERSVSAVKYIDDQNSSSIISASHVIVAAGPWTSSLLPDVPISGMRAHSITIRPSRPVSAYALFTEISLPRKITGSTHASPEIYTRPNNEVYACSPGDGEPLPDGTQNVKIDERTCDALFKQVASISPVLAAGEVTAKQACYLPNVNSGPRGCPIIGEVDNVRGLVIAAGHTCWVRTPVSYSHLRST